jgi:4-oxalocrotonate tautomerase
MPRLPAAGAGRKADPIIVFTLPGSLALWAGSFTIAKCEEKSVSVAFEEIRPEDWVEKVYRPDILENQQRLYKKPGYNPFE